MKKSNIFNIIFIIIIVVLIVLLLTQCMKKQEVIKETGNVDIFEINCDKNDKCITDTNVSKDVNEKDNTSVDSVTSKKANKTKVKGASLKKNNNNEDTSDDIDLTVFDDNIIWSNETNIDVFSNSMYEEKKIAPTSTNTYQFKIKNNNQSTILYSIDFDEKNDYDIDMRYRIRKGQNYINGEEWVKFNELNINDIELTGNETDTYYLEWKWFEGINDTTAGEAAGTGYLLKIKIEAKSIS